VLFIVGLPSRDDYKHFLNHVVQIGLAHAEPAQEAAHEPAVLLEDDEAFPGSSTSARG
jgi:hypothetical protein